MNPRLLFHNVYALGTPTSSPAAATGFPATNVSGWRPGAAFAWKAGGTTNPTTLSVTVSSTTVDSIFIAGHNFGSQGVDVTVSLTSPAARTCGTIPSTWGRAYWMAGFASTTGTTFTLSFSRASGSWSPAALAGVVVLGQALELPLGMQPGHDVKGWSPSREDAFSETGFPLGGYFTSSRQTISLEWPDPGFSNAEFYTKAFPNFDQDFRNHANALPFAFGADLDRDNEGLFCRLRATSLPFGALNTYRTLGFTADVHSPR